jgi:hypothetical protein
MQSSAAVMSAGKEVGMGTVVTFRLGLACAVAVVGLLLGGGPAFAQGGKTASFDMAIVNSGPSGQVTVDVKMWLTPTQARADINDPLKGQAKILVTNGWFYQLVPAQKKGVKAPLPPELKSGKDNFAALMGLFAFDASRAIKMSKKVRTETMSGFACDVYSNTVSEGPASRTISVWMPQKMDPQFPVKAVMTDKLSKKGVDVTQNVTITLNNIKLNAPIPAATFQIPAGYKIQTAKASPVRQNPALKPGKK